MSDSDKSGHGDGSDHDKNHGHGHKVMITVNGQEIEVDDKDVTYQEISKIAYPELADNPDAMFTITYRRGGDDDLPEGQLLLGKPVKVKKGMIFDVVPSTKS